MTSSRLMEASRLELVAKISLARDFCCPRSPCGKSRAPTQRRYTYESVFKDQAARIATVPGCDRRFRLSCSPDFRLARAGFLSPANHSVNFFFSEAPFRLLPAFAAAPPFGSGGGIIFGRAIRSSVFFSCRGASRLLGLRPSYEACGACAPPTVLPLRLELRPSARRRLSKTELSCERPPLRSGRRRILFAGSRRSSASSGFVVPLLALHARRSCARWVCRAFVVAEWGEERAAASRASAAGFGCRRSVRGACAAVG